MTQGNVPGVDPQIQAALDSPYEQDGVPIRMTSYVMGETLLGKASVLVAADVDLRKFGFEEKYLDDLPAQAVSNFPDNADPPQTDPWSLLRREVADLCEGEDVVLEGRFAFPRVYSNAAAAEQFPGAVSTVFVRMPGDPTWVSDPTPPRLRPANGEQALGLAAAFTVVDALRRAGAGPTRAAVLTALRRSVEADNPFLVPGIVVRGGIHQIALQRWSAGRWRIFTPPLAR